MNTYLFPIKIALVFFPIIAFLVTFPFAIYQYRKYGYINKLRVFILYSFLLFLITAYFLVILPLPKNRDIRSLQAPGTKHYQLIPFAFISDFLRETRVDFSKLSTYKYLLKDRSVLQVVFNGILLTPLGIYLRYYFKESLKKIIFITFLVSLFFELTQLSGLYGIYNAPYRIFDVNDLILNTLGGVLGYFIAPLFTFFLPKVSELDKDVDLENIKVGLFRRGVALAIDWTILHIFVTKSNSILIRFFIIFIYFILVVHIINGRTLGKWIVRIKIKGKNNRLTFKEVFKRYAALYFVILGVDDILITAVNLNNDDNIISVILIVLLFILNTAVFIHFLLAVITKQRFFYEKLSDTRNVVIK